MATRIVFNLYAISTPNTGDSVVSPLDYYSIPYAHKFNLLTTKPSEIKDSVILVGGGGVLCFFDYFRRMNKGNNKLVGWGLGFNEHTTDLHKPHRSELVAKFDLLGIRNFDAQPDSLPAAESYVVPCVSCKHEAFDRNYEIREEVRVYEHMQYGIDLVPNQPRYINTLKRHSFEEVIAWIGGCRKIVTSSYHGAYWGLLLGKEVYIANVFSTKFRCLPGAKIVNSEAEVQGATPPPNFLQKCRRKNDSFFERFVQLRKEAEKDD